MTKDELKNVPEELLKIYAELVILYPDENPKLLWSEALDKFFK